MNSTQDLFISHAGADKAKFIEPLSQKLAEYGVTYWLDSIEIAWGDNVPLRLNDGLRLCTYVLLCLSPRFLKRTWPEAELSAAFTMQTDSGAKRVLPLILDGKEQVLSQYPLLSSLAYREFTQPAETARQIADFVGKSHRDPTSLNVVIESVHTGALCNLRIPPNVSVRWLADRAGLAMGLSTKAETGAYTPFHIRWVLVDTKAETEWLALSRVEQREVHAIVKTAGNARISKKKTDKLRDIGVYEGVVLHMYAVEDEDYPPTEHLAIV